MPLRPGDTLRHRYRIDETLGQGGMGAVYRAFDINLGVPVAVKANLFTSEDYARQFRREATILASLRHPNLPRVTDHFVIQDEGQYLVMDYVEGEDLRQILEREGPVSPAQALPWFVEVADALAYLHSRSPSILHRDIKPGNIKITPDNRAILVDFGLAKVEQGDAATSTGAKAMTPGFSPPEQYGSGSTDARTDVYSLAATLYTALTAAIPEDSLERVMGRAELTSIRARNPQVSAPLARAIEKALELDPDDRYQTVGTFAQALTSARSANQPTVVGKLPYLEQTVVSDRRTIRRDTQEVRSTQPPARTGLGSWPVMLVISLTIVIVAVGALFAVPGLGEALAGVLPEYLRNSGSPSPVTAEVIATSPPTPAGATQATSVGKPPTEEPKATAMSGTEVISAGPSPTPVGGGVGQIAFASARDGLPQVYLMNVDGTGVTRLTDLADGACQPDWSPDGTRIAFTSPCRTSREIYPGSSVWVTGVDGSDLKPLSAAPGGDFDPAWSPNGDQIAFTSLRDGHPQVYVMQADGSRQTNLSESSALESEPDWSPSGSQLLYVSVRSGVREVWIRPSGGGEGRRLSRSGGRDNSDPNWSPDGEMVVFSQDIGGVSRLVVTRFIEGGAPEVRVCPEGPLSVQPMSEARWSVDGRWFVFETWPTGVEHQIAIMSTSCTSYALLTDHPGLDFDAVWRPEPQSAP